MGIEEQLRAYALELRDRGVPREQATAMLRARRQQLEAGQARQTPQRPAPRAEDSEGLSLSQYARLAGQGLTFGFSDELEAAFRGGLAALPGGRSPREAARETLEAAREDVEQAYERRPGTAFATEIASGIIPAVLAAVPTSGGSLAAMGPRVAASAPRLARAARPLAQGVQWARANPIRGGAAYGALSGLGAGEGIPERFGGVLTGGVIGGTLGGVGRLIGAGVDLAQDVIDSRTLRKIAGNIAEEAERSGQAVSASEAQRQAVTQMRPSRATRRAMESVAESARETGYTPEQLARLNAPTGNLRQSATMLELPSRFETEIVEAGLLPVKSSLTPLQRTARGIAVGGGAEAQVIEEAISMRSLGRNQRLRQALERNTRVRRRPYADVAIELDDALKRNAANNYRAAYERSIPTSSIMDFIDRPEGFNWFERFYNQARAEAAAQVIEGRPGATLLPALYQEIETPEGVTKQFIDEIPVKALDYVKRAMDDVILASRSGQQQAIPAERVTTWRFGLNRLLERADEAVPEYANARRIYKSDADTNRAFTAAADGGPVFLPGDSKPTIFKPFMKESIRNIRGFLNDEGVSDAEKFRYIQGALDNLFSTFQETGDARDLTQKIFGSPAARERMQLLLGGRQELIRAMQEALPESVLARSANRVLGGSATAEKITDNVSQGGRVVETATAAGTGASALALRIMAQQVFDRFISMKFLRGLTQVQRALKSEALTMTPREFSEAYERIAGERIAEDVAADLLNTLRESATGVGSRALAREY